MDLTAILSDLRIECELIDQAIGALEDLERERRKRGSRSSLIAAAAAVIAIEARGHVVAGSGMAKHAHSRDRG